MARHWKIAIAVLVMSVLAGLLTFPALLRNVLRLQNAAATEEQARREIVQPALTTPTDAPVTARLFWASDTRPETLSAQRRAAVALHRTGPARQAADRRA